MAKHVSKQKWYTLLLENLENIVKRKEEEKKRKKKEEENLMSPTPTPRQSRLFCVWFYMIELMQRGQRHTRDSQMGDAM